MIWILELWNYGLIGRRIVLVLILILLDYVLYDASVIFQIELLFIVFGKM